jgi:hypothetical protein
MQPNVFIMSKSPHSYLSHTVCKHRTPRLLMIQTSYGNACAHDHVCPGTFQGQQRLTRLCDYSKQHSWGMTTMELQETWKVTLKRFTAVQSCASIVFEMVCTDRFGAQICGVLEGQLIHFWVLIMSIQSTVMLFCSGISTAANQFLGLQPVAATAAAATAAAAPATDAAATAAAACAATAAAAPATDAAATAAAACAATSACISCSCCNAARPSRASCCRNSSMLGLWVP